MGSEPYKRRMAYSVTVRILAQELLLLNRRIKFVCVTMCFLVMSLCSLDLLMTSRLTIVSREAKKKQAVCDEQVSYLHVAPL